MKILVLSFYYEPDLSAGSFRNTALVQALSVKLRGSDGIDVITTVPNRYNSYIVQAPGEESRENVTISRIALPSHHSGVFDQAKAYLSFVRGVFGLTRGKSYDVIYASSSRLMTAVLAGILSRRLNVPLYLDFRDIFTDTIGDIYSNSPVRLLLPLFRYLEKKTVCRANRVNLVSPAFVEYFQKIDRSKSYRVFTNGVDKISIIQNAKSGDGSNTKEILYAGNIGDGQGLEIILPKLAAMLDSTWRIRVIGAGGRLDRLKARVAEYNNILLDPPVSRHQLLQCYGEADILFLHLNDYPALHKVLPSKIFEYAATGKPILAGVAGFAKKFIQENVENSAVFPPGDVDRCLKALDRLDYNVISRSEFIEKYYRSKIMDELAKDIIDLAS